MKKLFFIFIATWIVSSAIAGNTDKTEKGTEKSASINFSGTVTDEKTGEVLTGVEVRVEGTEIKTYTDFDGKFSFQNMTPGNYSLIVSYISYNKARTEEVNLKEKDQILIKLNPLK
jgi:hypothetical protein